MFWRTTYPYFMFSLYKTWSISEKDIPISTIFAPKVYPKFKISGAQLVLKFSGATSSVLMFSWYNIWNLSEKDRIISKNSRQKFDESVKYQEHSWF